MNPYIALAPLSDPELLAKAAAATYGLKNHRYCESKKTMMAYTLQNGYFGPGWNPLADDGDALVMAVKCTVDITKAQQLYHDHVGNVAYHLDACESTRRAIVFAVVLEQIDFER